MYVFANSASDNQWGQQKVASIFSLWRSKLAMFVMRYTPSYFLSFLVATNDAIDLLSSLFLKTIHIGFSSWYTILKASIGLENVQNTDVNYPFLWHVN